MALLKTIKEIKNYFKEIFSAVASLVNGMKVTGKYFVNGKEIVTQRYPENRDQLKMFDRFKGELTLIHDENNFHLCEACNTCERKCPNGSIEVISTRVQGEDGRSKRVLEKYIYHLDTCIFCGICVQVCEEHALTFSQKFEHAVFDKKKLVKQLNHPGSAVKPKPETETTPSNDSN
jgi:NADH-quinone oxidoreductase subunit I